MIDIVLAVPVFIIFGIGMAVLGALLLGSRGQP